MLLAVTEETLPIQTQYCHNFKAIKYVRPDVGSPWLSSYIFGVGPSQAINNAIVVKEDCTMLLQNNVFTDWGPS